MRKRIAVFFMLVASLCVFAEETNAQKNSDADELVLSVGKKFSAFEIEKTIIVNEYKNADAVVSEILPVSDTICKLVLTVPTKIIGGVQDYVLYIHLGDICRYGIVEGFFYREMIGVCSKIQYNSITIIGTETLVNWMKSKK